MALAAAAACGLLAGSAVGGHDSLAACARLSACDGIADLVCLRHAIAASGNRPDALRHRLPDDNQPDRASVGLRRPLEPAPACQLAVAGAGIDPDRAAAFAGPHRPLGAARRSLHTGDGADASAVRGAGGDRYAGEHGVSLRPCAACSAGSLLVGLASGAGPTSVERFASGGAAARRSPGLSVAQAPGGRLGAAGLPARLRGLSAVGMAGMGAASASFHQGRSMIKQGILLAPSRIYSRRSMRLSLPLLALLAYSLGIVASLLQGDVHVTRDDGFYYFKIAQNIAGGAGSTFDGLHPTNGYHPLWLLCLVPLFWLTHAPDTALRLGILLEGLLQAVGVGVLYRTARLTCGPFAASFAALLWVWFSYPEALSGIEFSLHALAVLTVAYVYLRWFVHEPPDRPWPYLGLGLLLSLTFLARIDTLLLAVLFWLWLFRQEQRRGFARGSLARLAALALPVAITVLAYAGINIWLFGHPLPVSSLIKRDWSEQLLRSDPQYQAHGWLIAKAHASFWLVHEYREYYAVLLGSVGIGALFLAGERARDGSAWRDWHQRTLRPWGLFVVYSLLQLLSYLIIYHGDLSLRPWYYVIQRWLAALLLADVMAARGARRGAGPRLVPGAAENAGQRQEAAGTIQSCPRVDVRCRALDTGQPASRRDPGQLERGHHQLPFGAARGQFRRPRQLLGLLPDWPV